MTASPPPAAARPAVTVLLADPSLPDPTKREGKFHEEDFEAIEKMKAALEELGRYALSFWNRHEELLARLQAERPPFVLNFCDTGYRNNPLREWHVAALLELLEIPYSGAPPAAMALCYDKGAVRGVAAELGIAVPEERYCDTAEEALAGLGHYPVLFKPNQGDGSVGITQHAVAADAGEARAYLDYLAETLPGRPVLVQEYLPGPEYSIGAIGNPEGRLELLPMLEVDFSGLPDGLAPILSFESKTTPDSPYWTEIRFREARAAPAVRAELEATARRLFRRLGLRDYARFDFRGDAAGGIRLMEANPNPAWGYDGKLALMAGFAGWSYGALLERIVEAALERVARETG